MLKILDISEHVLPEIHESYEIIGKINEDIAKELGFSEELKVVAGGGDQAMGAIGTIHNLKGSFNRDDLTKAIVERICFSLRDCINVVKEKHTIETKARVIGGASKSDEFLQILADVLNIEIRRINTSEGGGLGAIILTMYALGYVNNINEACDKLIKEVDTFVPNYKNVLIYNEKFNKYKEVYYKLKK